MSSLSQHFEGRPRRRLHTMLDHSSKDRQRIFVNVFDVVTAVRDTRMRKGVTELLAVCHRSAREGGTRKCFGCLQRWTLAYAPVGVVLIEFVGDPRRSATDALFAGVCSGASLTGSASCNLSSAIFPVGTGRRSCSRDGPEDFA